MPVLTKEYLQQKLVPDVRKIAKKLQIKNYSKLKKAELITAILKHPFNKSATTEIVFEKIDVVTKPSRKKKSSPKRNSTPKREKSPPKKKASPGFFEKVKNFFSPKASPPKKADALKKIPVLKSTPKKKIPVLKSTPKKKMPVLKSTPKKKMPTVKRRQAKVLTTDSMLGMQRKTSIEKIKSRPAKIDRQVVFEKIEKTNKKTPSKKAVKVTKPKIKTTPKRQTESLPTQAKATRAFTESVQPIRLQTVNKKVQNLNLPTMSRSLSLVSIQEPDARPVTIGSSVLENAKQQIKQMNSEYYFVPPVKKRKTVAAPKKKTIRKKKSSTVY
jgi:hypothetical protein